MKSNIYVLYDIIVLCNVYVTCLPYYLYNNRAMQIVKTIFSSMLPFFPFLFPPFFDTLRFCRYQGQPRTQWHHTNQDVW